MLRRILSLSEDHGDDTDRRAKVYIIERIMDADPHAIPFSWEMVERELFHLKKGISAHVDLSDSDAEID